MFSFRQVLEPIVLGPLKANGSASTRQYFCLFSEYSLSKGTCLTILCDSVVNFQSH